MTGVHVAAQGALYSKTIGYCRDWLTQEITAVIDGAVSDRPEPDDEGEIVLRTLRASFPAVAFREAFGPTAEPRATDYVKFDGCEYAISRIEATAGLYEIEITRRESITRMADGGDRRGDS